MPEGAPGGWQRWLVLSAAVAAADLATKAWVSSAFRVGDVHVITPFLNLVLVPVLFAGPRRDPNVESQAGTQRESGDGATRSPKRKRADPARHDRGKDHLDPVRFARTAKLSDPSSEKARSAKTGFPGRKSNFR